MTDMPIEESYNPAIDVLSTRYASKLAIHSIIGSGCFGTVFLATDKETDRKVAVKICPFWSKEMQNLLFNESLILSLVDNPYFPKLYYCESYNRLFIMVLEYLPGKTLFRLLEEKGRLEESEIITISSQLLDALEYLHSNSIVHRDMKLENIIVADDLTIRVCDFGFSRFFDKGGLISDHCGSMYYCSPEVMRGESYSGVKNDIWTLGICILVMCIGSEKYYDLVDTHGQDVLCKPQILNRIVNPSKLREVLSRIFHPEAEKRAEIQEIRLLIGGKASNIKTGEICLLDPVVLDQMKMMGYNHNRVIERIKDSNFSEKHVYQLIFDKLYGRAAVLDKDQLCKKQKSMEVIKKIVERQTNLFCCTQTVFITLHFTQYICIERLLKPSKLDYIVVEASKERIRVIFFQRQLAMEFQTVSRSHDMLQMKVICKGGEDEYLEVVHHIVRSFALCGIVHQAAEGFS